MSAYKVVILGDFGVGKTSLVRRYVLDEFTDQYRATLGVHLYKYTEDFNGDSAPCKLVLWDIEGSTNADKATAKYLNGASGAIIVGDRSRRDPVAAMREAALLFERHLPGRPVAFALNKSDLGSSSAMEPAKSLANSFGGELYETSAKTGDQVPTIFNALASSILARNV